MTCARACCDPLADTGSTDWEIKPMATFTGTAGNDNLAGTTGTDTLEGLAGNDIYVVNHCDDVVTENPGEGIDTVKSTVTFALDANTENLTLTGSAAINGIGNDLDNILIGNNGGNRLITGLGQDTVNAGGGNDFVEVGGDLGGNDKIDGGAGIDKLILDGDYSAGLVFGLTTALNFERFSLADGNSYSLTLADITNATGLYVDGSKLTGANTLALDASAETKSALTAVGGAGDDTIIGGAGNDTLTGGAGADVLTGNGGIDTVRYDTSSAGVTVDLNSGTGSGGDAAGDQLSGIENLVGSIHDDHFTGDDLNNNIAAGAGHDTLIAGLGVDTLSGEDGNDYFTLDGNFTTADRVYGGDGNDTLELNGNYAAGLSFGSTVTGIENILLGGGFSYKLTLSATTAIGGLLVDGSALGAGENLILLGGSAGAI
jgi:Ca2+-binding RTX toxin-like protein